MEKVYGPYLRKDGRMHVVIVNDSGKKTKSYPRFILEKHLGRELKNNETVDHINGDFTNNDITNLQILSRENNAIKKYSDFPELKRKTITFTCTICGAVATKFLNNVEHNRKKGKAGPFCSRKCAGIYSVFKEKLRSHKENSKE